MSAVLQQRRRIFGGLSPPRIVMEIAVNHPLKSLHLTSAEGHLGIVRARIVISHKAILEPFEAFLRCRTGVRAEARKAMNSHFAVLLREGMRAVRVEREIHLSRRFHLSLNVRVVKSSAPLGRVKGDPVAIEIYRSYSPGMLRLIAKCCVTVAS